MFSSWWVIRANIYWSFNLFQTMYSLHVSSYLIFTTSQKSEFWNKNVVLGILLTPKLFWGFFGCGFLWVPCINIFFLSPLLFLLLLLSFFFFKKPPSLSVSLSVCLSLFCYTLYPSLPLISPLLRYNW